MADIRMDFPVEAPAPRVFEMFATPVGLDAWWTETSAGEPAEGNEYALGFGSGYDWRAKVTQCVANEAFELQLTDAHEDWANTRVGVNLEERGDRTFVRFHHEGWHEANDHWRTSCYCWAMYLRILKRFVEHGERVPYGERLDA